MTWCNRNNRRDRIVVVPDINLERTLLNDSSDEESEDAESENAADPADDGNVGNANDEIGEQVLQREHRYPQRNRAPRVIPGAIPWDAIPE